MTELSTTAHNALVLRKVLQPSMIFIGSETTATQCNILQYEKRTIFSETQAITQDCVCCQSRRQLRFYVMIQYCLRWSQTLKRDMNSVSQKKSPPLRGPDISHFPHKRWRIFNRFFYTPIIRSYLR